MKLEYLDVFNQINFTHFIWVFVYTLFIDLKEHCMIIKHHIPMSICIFVEGLNDEPLASHSLGRCSLGAVGQQFYVGQDQFVVRDVFLKCRDEYIGTKCVTDDEAVWSNIKMSIRLK